MSAMITFAPSSANFNAPARPIPELPPVTMAVLPSSRPPTVAPLSVLFDLNNHLDLHGDVAGKRSHTHRGASVPAAFTEQLGQQIRRAVDNFRLPDKAG